MKTYNIEHIADVGHIEPEYFDEFIEDLKNVHSLLRAVVDVDKDADLRKVLKYFQFKPDGKKETVANVEVNNIHIMDVKFKGKI